MYIAPNSTIKLLEEVPLLNTYEDSLYFADEPTQHRYFESKVRHSFTNNMYQRYAKNRLRIHRDAGAIYGCNYLMFQNTGFDTKWFYAFINKIEYINNEVTEITYEIDVIQTYLFNWSFSQCFIERCHTVSDNLFEHTIEENLPVGDAYVALGVGARAEFNMNNLDCMVYTSVGADGTKQNPHLMNGVLMPFGATHFKIRTNGAQDDNTTDGIPALKDFLDAYIDAGREDAIVSMFIVPRFITELNHLTQNKDVDFYVTQFNYNGTAYTPKNKKCFNYPYHLLMVSNNNGGTSAYHFEDFTIANGVSSDFKRVSFNIAGACATAPSVICSPKNHRNLSVDYDFSLTYNSFPEVAFVGDAYKAWWAQHKYAVIGNATNGFANIGASLFNANQSMVSKDTGYEQFIDTSGKGLKGDHQFLNQGGFTPTDVETTRVKYAGQMITGLIGAATDALVGTNQTLIQPPDLHGLATSENMSIATDRCKFSFYELGVKPDIIKRVDDFFTKFGYKVCELGVPLLKARPHWTFIKTAGCTFTEVYTPSDDMQLISAIFDKGITFWVDGDEIGNYSLDNSPEIVPNNG